MPAKVMDSHKSFCGPLEAIDSQFETNGLSNSVVMVHIFVCVQHPPWELVI